MLSRLFSVAEDDSSSQSEQEDETIWNNLKQFETILFPQDMIQDIYVTLEYNI